MKKSVVSEKGQVTIPKALRERLGLRPGAVLEFAAEEGRLVGTKATAASPVDEVFGILRLDKGTDAAVAELRDADDRA